MANKKLRLVEEEPDMDYIDPQYVGDFPLWILRPDSLRPLRMKKIFNKLGRTITRFEQAETQSEEQIIAGLKEAAFEYANLGQEQFLDHPVQFQYNATSYFNGGVLTVELVGLNRDGSPRDDDITTISLKGNKKPVFRSDDMPVIHDEITASYLMLTATDILVARMLPLEQVN